MITELFRFGELFMWFLICWCSVFLLHEFFHVLVCEIQGGKGKIEIWWYCMQLGSIPSMSCSCEAKIGKSINWNYFYYAGGLGAGFISTIASIPFYWIYPPLFIGLFILGITNLLYGIYEGLFREKWQDEKYMSWHYLVEIVGVIIGVILLRNIIWSWVI